MTNEPNVSRRLVLQQSLALGVVTVGSLGVFTAACGKKELSCDDASSLPPADAQTRTLLAYVDKTPIAEKYCSNCQQYKAAAENQCGGCNLVKGPIHPKGYCKSWAAKIGGLRILQLRTGYCDS